MGQLERIRLATVRIGSLATGMALMAASGPVACTQTVVTEAPPGAAPAPAQPPVDDPPALVGRLSYLDGQVSYRPAADTEWAPAVPNRPITTGDRLWADADGR